VGEEEGGEKEGRGAGEWEGQGEKRGNLEQEGRKGEKRMGVDGREMGEGTTKLEG
jgi:hypothetical protein